MYLLRNYITYFNIIPSYKLFNFIYLLYNYFLSSLNRNTCCIHSTLYISHLNIIGRAEQFVKLFIMYFFLFIEYFISALSNFTKHINVI
jgi:hypothetical protein